MSAQDKQRRKNPNIRRLSTIVATVTLAAGRSCAAEFTFADVSRHRLSGK